MEDKLRDRLRLNLLIKLALLPRWVKHDFWRQPQPQNDTARAKMVDAILDTVDEVAALVNKEKPHYHYRGW
jgi:hypothetical protein